MVTEKYKASISIICTTGVHYITYLKLEGPVTINEVSFGCKPFASYDN